MQGAINDAACAIAREAEQVFDLDVTSFSDIYPGGEGKINPLQHSFGELYCDKALGNSISEWRQFQITFDGNVDGQMFGVGEGVGCGTGYQRCGWQYRLKGRGIPLPLVIIHLKI
ncbi:hypothetical protein M8494_27370 [Serratia ureilytica]